VYRGLRESGFQWRGRPGMVAARGSGRRQRCHEDQSSRDQLKGKGVSAGQALQLGAIALAQETQS